MAVAIKVTGKVTKSFPGATFCIELDNGRIITAYLSGKMHINHVRVLVGDTVDVVVSPIDLTIGRIVYRRRD